MKWTDADLKLNCVGWSPLVHLSRTSSLETAFWFQYILTLRTGNADAPE